jgi:predicted RNA polymerase sigma factor
VARADRPALTGGAAVGGTDPRAASRRAVEAVWRIESARITGALARYTGDFGLAEDVAQQALAEALDGWPRDGVPPHPAAWLLTVARRRARVALTLRVVGGLTTEEIARAFLVPVATVQARITRAKKTIAAARVPFEVPPPEQRPARLGGVLNVLYVVFTEGSTATAGDDLIRPDVAREALRLARVLSRLLPGEAEVHGLLALMELTAARFPARTGPGGEVILLEDQDRRLWDRPAITRGQAALTRATASGRGLGPYGLQAAIAACHAVAPSVGKTDWESIVVLYEALGRIAPSPVVDLNRAVAVAMVHGPQAALAIVDDLAAGDRLAGSHLVPSVRGELLARLGRRAEARREFELAAGLCANEAERALLRRKAALAG